jgi:hypothetical protein
MNPVVRETVRSEVGADGNALFAAPVTIPLPGYSSSVEVEMDKPMIDVMARVARRIDRPGRGQRCRERSRAAIAIGALLLLIGGVDRPRTIEAQQVARREGEATDSTSLAEARIKVARRALNSIKRRESNCNIILYNETFNYHWSMRLLIAQFEIAKGYTDRVAIFEAHLGRMKELEERVNAHYSERKVTDLDQMNAVFKRVEAESWLAKVKQGQAPWTILVHD